MHSQSTGDRARPLIAIQPTSNGVAGKAHDATAILVEFGDNRFVDRVNLVKNFLRAPMGAQLLSQRRGQRGKARYIGE